MNEYHKGQQYENGKHVVYVLKAGNKRVSYAISHAGIYRVRQADIAIFETFLANKGYRQTK